MEGTVSQTLPTCLSLSYIYIKRRLGNTPKVSCLKKRKQKIGPKLKIVDTPPFRVKFTHISFRFEYDTKQNIPGRKIKVKIKVKKTRLKSIFS